MDTTGDSRPLTPAIAPFDTSAKQALPDHLQCCSGASSGSDSSRAATVWGAKSSHSATRAEAPETVSSIDVPRRSSPVFSAMPRPPLPAAADLRGVFERRIRRRAQLKVREALLPFTARVQLCDLLVQGGGHAGVLAVDDVVRDVREHRLGEPEVARVQRMRHGFAVKGRLENGVAGAQPFEAV